MQTYTAHHTEREITQFIVLSFFNEFCFKIRTVVVYWVFVCLFVFFFNFSMNHYLQSRIIRMSFLLCERWWAAADNKRRRRGCCRQNGDFSNSILIFRIFVRFCSGGRVYKCNYNDEFFIYNWRLYLDFCVTLICILVFATISSCYFFIYLHLLHFFTLQQLLYYLVR